MFNAKIIDNVLSEEECEYLINAVKDIEPWQSAGEFWHNRAFDAKRIYNEVDPIAGKILYSARLKIEQVIKDLYNEKEIFADLSQMIRWFPGMEQIPHCDDMKDTEGNESLHHRHYGAIIYLNDNYSGGHTFYPQHNFEIIPKVGSLAIHPGDPNHMHGVTKIEDNLRYTIASFWTRDKSHFDGWII